MTEVYPIVFGTDENYIKYLAVAIQSIIENVSKENTYKIFILYEDLNTDLMRKINLQKCENVHIEFVNVKEYLKKYNDKLSPIHHYSKAMYYRLLIPEIFKKYSKVLYLDCDLVVNCDIEEFFQIDLKEFSLAAINDIGVLNLRKQWFNYSKVIGIQPERYYNSGVLILDTKKMGKFDIIKKSYEILAKSFKYHFPDQDILNILFKDKVLLLDYKYNFQWCEYLDLNDRKEFFVPELYDLYLEALSDFKILHFTSGVKPWTNPEITESYYFWKYARKTPFYEDILQAMFFYKFKERKKISKYVYYKYKLKSKIPGRKQNYYIKKFENIEKKLAI